MPVRSPVKSVFTTAARVHRKSMPIPPFSSGRRARAKTSTAGKDICVIEPSYCKQLHYSYLTINTVIVKGMSLLPFLSENLHLLHGLRISLK
ncbi:MAG TPA: hypothetical protein DCP92_04385 [Nitrospiraceae bacterium]|nr:hypothetical protein [Nitrospiraceae bacterium]